MTNLGQVAVIINDRIDVALAVGADGVHVGQDDITAATARALLGPLKVSSTHRQPPHCTVIGLSSIQYSPNLHTSPKELLLNSEVTLALCVQGTGRLGEDGRAGKKGGSRWGGLPRGRCR